MTVYRIPENLKTIIFDIDGTLYKNDEYINEQIDSQIRAFAQSRNFSNEKARQMVNSYREEWAKLHDGKRPSLNNALHDMGVQTDEIIAWRKELTHPENYLSFDEALADSLKELAAVYRLLCITNNPASIGCKTLEILGAQPFISEIIGFDTCKTAKPDPKVFELALKRAATPVEQCISVGDRYDIDIAVPLEMGMGGILVSGVQDVYKLKNVLELTR